MIVKEKDPNKKATQDDSVLKGKPKLSKAEKAKAKFDKIEAKREKKERQKEIYKDLKDGYKEFESKDSRTKRAKAARVKKIKDKIDYKMALREFPIRLIKEVQKVRWPKQKDLGSKLAWVIGFMLSLAILFYFVDWGIQALFGVAKII